MPDVPSKLPDDTSGAPAEGDQIQRSIMISRAVWDCVKLVAINDRTSASEIVEQALLGDARIAYELDLRAKRQPVNITNEGADRG